MSSEAKFKKILVAFDGSEDAMKAVRVSAGLAKETGAELLVVHAFMPPLMAYGGASGVPMVNFEEIEAAASERAYSILARALDAAKVSGLKPRGEVIKGTSIVQSIVDYASSEKADLIVAGTRGMTGFKRLVVGSVSSGLVNHADCSVLVVR
jgi:nucleotide-binding universal stress UspA family protein